MGQNQQQQKFQCSGDCLNCRAVNDRRIQWQYCSAQFSYNALRTLQAMQESINTMAGTIEELKAKVNAIQNSEAMVFEPDMGEPPIEPAENQFNNDSTTDTAHEGSGATE